MVALMSSGILAVLIMSTLYVSNLKEEANIKKSSNLTDNLTDQGMQVVNLKDYDDTTTEGTSPYPHLRLREDVA